MKIGIIGPAWPLRGGLADFDERLARELQSMGHEVTIYSYSLQYPALLFPGKTQLTDAPAPEGLNIRSIINSINPLSWLKAGNIIRKAAPDVVFVRYWMPFMGPALGTVLRRIKKNRKTKIITIADNILPHERRPGDAQFTAYFLPPVDAFITMSDEVTNDVKKLSAKPVVRLHHPLYDNYGDAIPQTAARELLGLPRRKYWILFFGFIRKYKGLDLLLHAMTDERVKAAGINLIIAGEYYGDRELYEEIISQNALQERVWSFTDFIPNDDVKRYFSAADCVMLPYRSATQSGITQIAYHFERGMIATRVGGLPEAVKDGSTGILCAPDATSIADALLRFFTPGSVPNLSENLAAAKSQYSWSAFADRALAMITDSGFGAEQGL